MKYYNIIISLIASFVFMVLGAVIADAEIITKPYHGIGVAISVLNAFLFIYWSCNLGYKLWLDNKLIS